MRINAYEVSGSPAQQTVYLAERLLFFAEGIDFACAFVDSDEGFAFVAVSHGNVDLAVAQHFQGTIFIMGYTESSIVVVSQ